MPANPSPDPPTNTTDTNADVQLDVQLIEGCRAGDNLAWVQIINKYQRLVMSVPLGLNGLQHTFAMLVQKNDHPASFAA